MSLVISSACDSSLTHLSTYLPPFFTLSLPRVAPLAPGNRAKRLSKLRFSWTIKTTCWIGELEEPGLSDEPAGREDLPPLPQPARRVAATAARAARQPNFIRGRRAKPARGA